MNIKDLKKVHVIGAGGIGVSAAAKWLLHEGVQVTGSDLLRTNVSELLASRGARLAVGHRAENIEAGTDLVLFSSAVPETNPERVRARELGIREMTYNEFLGALSKTRRTIAVSGTHGKSTTTAMLGRVLEAAGLDPLVIVGSLVPEFPDGNLRYGKGEWFVVEACEYKRHFLELTPELAIVTNIEADHLDYYKDVQDIKSAFLEFTKKAKKTVWCVDDPESAATLKFLPSATVSVDQSADYVARNIEHVDGVQRFEVRSEGAAVKLSLAVPGKHNVIDATLAFAAAREIGVPTETIAKTLSEYRGIWRRFERVGEISGVPIYSDYGHHPTEIRATLQAARELFPKHRLIVAFKPHQRNRTKNLFAEFARAFERADLVVLAEIYDVAGREEGISVSSAGLVDAIRAHNSDIGVRQTVVYEKTNGDVYSFLEESIRPNMGNREGGDVVFVVGAGDIDEVARWLVSGKPASARGPVSA